jgi:putative membrane protein PagO
MGLAGLLLCAAGVVIERPDPAAFTGASLGALIYLGAFASVAGFLAYFQLLCELGPVPLSLVFVFFPVVAQAVAVAGGERPLRTASLALLALVLAASALALSPPKSPDRRRLRLPAWAPARRRAAEC